MSAFKKSFPSIFAAAAGILTLLAAVPLPAVMSADTPDTELGADTLSTDTLSAGTRDAIDRFHRFIASPPAKEHPAIITAEQNSRRAILFRAESDWSDPTSILWQWDPAQAPELTAEQVKWFGNISDVKPVMGGKVLLEAASGGGVALIRLEDKKVLFLGYAGGNTHSAALLPDGNIVSASSTGGYLRLFVRSGGDKSDDSRIGEAAHIDYPFTDAHGVVWDASRGVLWALGGDNLAGYYYRGSKENPTLEEFYREKFPGKLTGGHDLYPMPGEDLLLFTTVTGVGVFDPAARRMLPLSGRHSIKSISIDSGGAVIMLVPVEQWWSETISYFAPGEPAAGTYPKAKFYKARWWMPNTFSEPEE